jgi:hypothetical protein
MPHSFYEELLASDKFVMALGRLTLSAARLETAIKSFMQRKGIENATSAAPLGVLLKNLASSHKIDRTTSDHLHALVKQRNYFTHKLHEYLVDYQNMPDEVEKFTSRANELKRQMEFFGDLFMNAE